MPKTVKHGLGRGLGALMGDPAPDEPMDDGDRVVEILVSDIDANPAQPRRSFDEASLRELADSISSVGVIQPIIVTPVENRYQLIAGERRWRASMLAGKTTVPAIIRDWNASRKMEAALIENLQRDDLNPVEEAQGIRQLMEQCGYTQAKAADRLGISRPALANLLRLLTLPDEVLSLVRAGSLSAGHARALCALEDPARQIRLANLCVSEGWTVRQMESIARLPEARPQTRRPPKDPAFRQMENMARELFGTRVVLDGDRSRGRLVINYYSEEDLQRIWERLEAGLEQKN